MNKATDYRPEHACVKMCYTGLGAGQPCDYICTVRTKTIPGAKRRHTVELVPCPFATIAEAASCGHYLEWDSQYVIGDVGKPGISGVGCWALAEAIVRSFWRADEHTALRRIEDHWIGGLFIGGRGSW